MLQSFSILRQNGRLQLAKVHSELILGIIAHIQCSFKGLFEVLAQTLRANNLSCKKARSYKSERHLQINERHSIAVAGISSINVP